MKILIKKNGKSYGDFAQCPTSYWPILIIRASLILERESKHDREANYVFVIETMSPQWRHFLYI